MSSWTHVAGIVRFDFLPGLDPEDTSFFDSIFGKQCLWGDSRDVWNECNEHPSRFMPMGSEGSLRKVVWRNPDQSSIASHAVSIFGDLRDHYDPKGIITWFKNSILRDHLWVRNAVITAQNDIYGTETWTYMGKDKECEDS